MHNDLTSCAYIDGTEPEGQVSEVITMVVDLILLAVIVPYQPGEILKLSWVSGIGQGWLPGCVYNIGDYFLHWVYMYILSSKTPTL